MGLPWAMELLLHLPLLSEQSCIWGTGDGEPLEAAPALSRLLSQAGSEAEHRQEDRVVPIRLAEKSATSLSLIVIFEPQLNGSAPIYYLLKQTQSFQNDCHLFFFFTNVNKY